MSEASRALSRSLWDRTKWHRLAFIAGLVLGLFGGWLLHGLISLAIRLFVLLIFLAPLAVALWFWWRLRRDGNAAARGGSQTTYLEWGQAGRAADGRFGAPPRRTVLDPEEIEVIDQPDLGRLRRE